MRGAGVTVVPASPGAPDVAVRGGVVTAQKAHATNAQTATVSAARKRIGAQSSACG